MNAYRTPRSRSASSGLGVMGRPMASHLAARRPSRCTLFDVAPGVARELAGALADARVAAHRRPRSPRASDIVVTMVPNGEVVR